MYQWFWKHSFLSPFITAIDIWSTFKSVGSTRSQSPRRKALYTVCASFRIFHCSSMILVFYCWVTNYHKQHPEAIKNYYLLVQFSSVTHSCPTLCDPMDCKMSGFPIHHQLLELAQTHLHWIGDVIQPSRPLLSPSPPLFSLSQHQGLFQWVNSSHQVAKVLEFQLQISPSNEYLGLISFRMDWLDLLAVQGTLKSFLQQLSSKASILQCSAYFMVQLLYPYMTTGKNTALTRWTFVSKVMSLLFNILSSLVITFLPRSKCLLISWLQSPSEVILEPKKIKSLTVSIVSSSICMKWWDQMPWSSFFECWILSQVFHSPLSVSSRCSLVLLRFLP